jgi:gliding motility-associated-like protein
VVTNGGCRDTLIQQVRPVDESPDFNSVRVACKIATIGFNATTATTSNIVNYAWDFGNGTGNTAATTISNVYTQVGYYTVMLVTTDINGCRDTVTKPNYIRINGPTADFSATNTHGCKGLTTLFTNLSVNDGVNPIISWKFDFGDGSSQSFFGPPFLHTYNLVDTFSVKLTVTDAAGCIDSIRYLDLVITTDPTPNFVSPDTLSCPGAPVRFNNLSLPADVTSSWDFGDGATSTATHPVHSYAAPGLYTIILRVTDSNGCVDSIRFNNYIKVDRPFAGFSMSDSVSSCLPFEVQFTNTSQFYIASLWDFGPTEGTSNLTNPTHYFSQPGTFQVKLIVTSFGLCKDSIIRTIQTFDTAGSVINYIPIRGCSPLTLTYNSFTNGQISTYLWDFGDGTIVTTSTPNVTHIYTTFGNYLPKLIMEDPSGCKIPVTGADTVYVTGAKAKFGMDTTALCDQGVIHFTDSTTWNDPVVNYDWDFGDGTTSNVQHPTHYYSTPGLYTVRLIVTTQIGCRDTLTKPALIRIVASPETDIVGDTVICVGESIVHSGIFLVTDTLNVTWLWTFPNGNTSVLQNPPQQFYVVPGTHTVTMITTNTYGCRDTVVQNIYVNPLPSTTLPKQLTVQAGFPITIPGTYSPNTISWLWSPPTNLSCSNCPNPVVNPQLTSVYQVHFVDSNGCKNDAAIEILVICKNANVFMPNTFTPNGDGNNDIFYPRGKGLERVRMLRVFDRWGEIVFEKREFPVNQSAYGWNGTYKGTRPKPDVYIYQLEVYCENGEIIRLDGNVALIL